MIATSPNRTLAFPAAADCRPSPDLWAGVLAVLAAVGAAWMSWIDVPPTAYLSTGDEP